MRKGILFLCLGIFAVCGFGAVIVGMSLSSSSSTPESTGIVNTGQGIKGEPNQSLPPGRIPDGVWKVGAKGGVAPGTYTVTKKLTADDNCYWQISRDFAGNKIVANDIPGGGTPEVTLKKDQFFKTEGCGDWAKSDA
jgi:hypothetical protein